MGCGKFDPPACSARRRTEPKAKQMIVPTIHNNGTSREELLKQHIAVLDACHALTIALANASPHGRDYYPQGDDAYRTARDAHNADRKAVADIRARWQAIAEAFA
jgi:hypothetical protein